MGKVTSLYGKTTGKIGSIVFSTSGGETIAREYNPHVSNPSTMPQVNQRARMKLMSQISACLAPSIVMQKSGLVSRRNKFVKKNIDSCYASNGVAQISYENVQLTEGSIGLPQIIANIETNAETGLSELIISLASAPAINVSRVIYSIFEKTDESKLQLLYSTIAETRIQDTKYFPFVESATAFAGKELVIYAYGMCDTSEAASARYGNLNVSSGEDIATLVANRSINYEDFQFTQTRGATLGSDGQPITPTPSGSVRIFATALGNGGSVTGGGTYEVGTQVTLTATANSGYQFRAWLKNGTSEVLSTANPWTFEAHTQIDAIASFDVDAGGGL